jgi:hypothetical protein
MPDCFASMLAEELVGVLSLLLMTGQVMLCIAV